MAGETNPITSHSLAVRAMNRFSSHWLNWFVGQTTPVLAPARAQVRTSSSVRNRALVLKPSRSAASRSTGPCVPSQRAVARLDSWNSTRGHSAVGSR